MTSFVVIDRLNREDKRGWGAAVARIFPGAPCETKREVVRLRTEARAALEANRSWQPRFVSDFVAVAPDAVVLLHLTNTWAEELARNLPAKATLLGTSGGSIPPWLLALRTAGRRVGFVPTPAAFEAWLNELAADPTAAPPWPGEGHAERLDALLDRFAALDILLQGYLAVRDPGFLDPELRAALPGLTDPALRAHAEEVTSPARLFRPPGACEPEGHYWFDACVPAGDDPGPFSAATVELLERCGAGPDVRAIFDPAAPGEVDDAAALRLVWRLIREGTVDAEGGSVRLAPSPGPAPPHALPDLLAKAHRQLELLRRTVAPETTSAP